MPGVPRTKRCERCRRRKIKCDESWPQCTPCRRSDTICSGPLVGIKFVYNDGNSETHVNAINKSAQSASSNNNEQSLIRFRSYVNAAPQHHPIAASDRVAAGFVTHLEKSPEPIREFLLTAGFFKLLPARVGADNALRDCVALFTSAWSNFQRGLPVEETTDPMLYGRALRSLRNAIVSRQPSTREILAAISVMERFEIMFDTGRPLNSSAHRDGIVTLMNIRGPPRLDDELEVMLALDNYLNLCTHWMVKGGENFLDHEPWRRVMRMAIDRHIDSQMRKYAYYLELYMGDWVSVVRDLRLLLSDPLPNSKQDQALALQRKVTDLETGLDSFGGSVIEIARSQGKIVELPDTSCPVGTKYDFNSLVEQRCLVTYAMIRIVFNRVHWSVDTVLYGHADASLEVEHEYFCRQIWMSLPYTREASLMAAILFADSLWLSYEGARGPTKEYLLSCILQITRYRGRLPNDRDLVDGYLIGTAMAFTGRIPFRERTDFPYWKHMSEVTMQQKR